MQETASLWPCWGPGECRQNSGRIIRTWKLVVSFQASVKCKRRNWLRCSLVGVLESAVRLEGDTKLSLKCVIGPKHVRKGGDEVDFCRMLLPPGARRHLLRHPIPTTFSIDFTWTLLQDVVSRSYCSAKFQPRFPPSAYLGVLARVIVVDT